MATTAERTADGIESLDEKLTARDVNGEKHLQVHDTRAVALLEQLVVELQRLNDNLEKRG
jgi:hypothetical protein